MAENQFVKNVRNLFFIKRLPKRHIPIEWKKPPDEQYEQMVHWEGLVSIKTWEDDDLSKFPVLKRDLGDLEQHLLPAFWEFNQKASHYQNRFYLYQWIFMLGAFITTVLAAFTTYLYTLPDDGRVLPEVLGYITAVISGVIAYFNVMSNQGSPQQRWAKSRRLTEELRTIYFKYLGHLEPFDTDDRVQRMREMVLSIRRKENTNA